MKRILACLFIVAVLPSMTAQPVQHTRASADPFATVAFAGHSLVGDRSECTCPVGPDGVCPCCGYKIAFICGQDVVPDDAVVQPGLSVPAQPDSISDLGPGAALFILAFIAWSKVLA